MTNQRLNPKLLEHLVDEFMDDGKRAVEFLRAAESLVLMPEGALPGHAELIAYSLREAMKAIPASQRTGGGGEWSVRSRAVVEAKKRYDLAKGLPGEDQESALTGLMQKIDEMAITHTQERIHQKKLIAVMISRTGVTPLSGGIKPVETYQGILDRLDRAVHGNMDIAEAREIWDECLEILNQLFLPPEIRYSTLDELAALEHPTEDNLRQLAALVSTPQHLTYFLKRVRDSEWLDLLYDANLLVPSLESGGWPVLAAVEHLREHHSDKLEYILDGLFDQYGSDAESSWYISRVALELGTQGHGIILRSLNKHRNSRPITSFAIASAEKADPSSDFVEKVVDGILNANTWDEVEPYTPKLTAVYCAGLTEENCESRIKLLCYKLKSPSVDDLDWKYFPYDRGHLGDNIKGTPWAKHFHVVLTTLMECLRKSASLCDSTKLLASVEPLKGLLKSRVRTWIFANSQASDSSLMISAVSEGIASRKPNADDADLVDMIMESCEAELFESPWKDALGTPPDLTELGTSLAENSVPAEWRRAHHWSALLPQEVWSHWGDAITVMAASYGQPSRDNLQSFPNIQTYFTGSPIGAAELSGLTPVMAAQRISEWRPGAGTDHVSARELARTLEGVVKNNIPAWATSPIAVASALRHPTYISHYLIALSNSKDSLRAEYSNALIELIKLTRTHPWPVIALGDSSFDFDDTWRPVEHAAVDLVKALADSDTGFSEGSDYVWNLLISEIRDRSEGSGIEDNLDHLTAAINRPCTRALEALLSFLAFERRCGNPMRPDFRDLLESVLLLEGADGAHFRAIIGPRFGFIRYLDEEWFDQNHPLLFGDDAPVGMGQLTTDLALHWGQPRRWLLENYKKQVEDAVIREVENSMAQYVVGLLNGFNGYSVTESVDFLKKIGKVSAAGELIGRLLRGQTSAEGAIVESSISFWREAIKLKSADAVYGFGWMAEVTVIDGETWNGLMVATLEISSGNIDWSHEVAERAASQPQSERTLQILNLLVRGLQDGWDRRNVGTIAKGALANASSLSETAEYKRLRTTLLERGIMD
ncbi:hypothetical protein ABZ372_07355 [Streptomyces sp. NPDC005921]|uniref:hypothetical protein n=1 Tax=Streptomyces sp. NPDC005827 TaxID=3157070 RepID=UPI0033ED70BC